MHHGINYIAITASCGEISTSIKLYKVGLMCLKVDQQFVLYPS